MKFINQIGNEIKNILRSKFLLIIGILILAASIIIPVVTVLGVNTGASYPGGPIAYATRSMFFGKSYYDNGEEPIVVDGVTIDSDSPFYWNIQNIQDEKFRYESENNMMSSPEALDLLLDLMDTELQFYLRAANQIMTYEDYRLDLVWSATSSLYDKFIYEHYESDQDALQEAIMYRYGYDPATFKEKYIDITSEERLQKLDDATGNIDEVFTVIESNDFKKYIDLRIVQANQSIEDVEEQIVTQEQLIIDNPSQEESINQYIEDLKKQIEYTQTNTIPILQYRLEKNIIPSSDMWQNQALNDIESSRSQLLYQTVETEEEFSHDQWAVQQYGTYAKYKAAMQKQIDQWNNNILIAQKCLDTEKPDMKYVPDGARNTTVSFLSFSTFVAMFAVLVGGWIIASEFQQGTVRLLMIRPRTRVKILMSKFVAALAVSLGLFLAGSLINLITNGICFGFADFGYPNFKVGGQVNFFMYYLPRFLACAVPILFGFCVAFMLSVLLRNIAASIAIPIFCFIGSFLAMQYLTYRNAVNWIIWTPIPFVQMSPFFAQNSVITNMLDRGIPVSLAYGIPLLLVLSAVCAVISVIVFKKRDITN